MKLILEWALRERFYFIFRQLSHSFPPPIWNARFLYRAFLYIHGLISDWSILFHSFVILSWFLYYTNYLQPNLVPGRLSPTVFLSYHLFLAFSWPLLHVFSKLYNHFVKCSQNSLIGALTRIALYFNLVRIDSFTDFQKSSIYINIFKSSKVFSCSLLFLDTRVISYHIGKSPTSSCN